MSKTKATVSLAPVHTDASISAVVRTVNLAFSSDPLIQWLRPNARPWAEQDPSSSKWQHRRVQSIMSHGQVFRSASVAQMAQDHLKMPSRSEDETSPEKKPQIGVSQDPHINTTDAGTVVFLHPPAGHLSWSLSRALLTCKLWLLELFDPALDEGCKEKRVDKLMAANTSSAQVLQKQHSKHKLWYLEVIAVHPALQSRGLGGGVMRWILESVGEQPIYLECTARGNVPFYEAFGFRVVEEVELIDDDNGEKLVYWVMIRTQDENGPMNPGGSRSGTGVR